MGARGTIAREARGRARVLASAIVAIVAQLAAVPASAGSTEISLSPEVFASTLNSVDAQHGGRLTVRTGLNYGGTLAIKRPFSNVLGLEPTGGIERITFPGGLASTAQTMDRSSFSMTKATVGLSSI